jgi:TonB-linked SusC/RagA family outer membrane protein
MKKLPTVFLSVMLLMFTLWTQAQTVNGTVTDAANNDPLPGVTVHIYGTTQGTVTDIDGNFTIEADSDARLVFSFIGMKTQEIDISGKTNFTIKMEPDIIGLEEVVAIGYGTAKVRDLTAPIVTVGAEEITRISSTSAVSAIQGAVPGVQVMDAGAPQGTPSVRIRGIGSMQGSAPLYIVDGMHFSNITFLNPNDIKEISVLKDASAAAIYGVRAAGGVILVTTKSGSRNKGVTVEYSGYGGIETTSNILEMSNGREYSTMMIEAGTPDVLDPLIDAFGAASDKITWQGTDYSYPAKDVDYYDELTENGIIMNHNLSVRGGSENLDYRVSASYYSAEGRLINDHKYERVNITNKINYKPYSWLELGTNIIIVHDKNKNNASTWAAMYNAVPILPLWEDNGDYGQRSIYGYITGSATSNPMVALDQADGYGNFNGGSRVMLSAHTEIDFFSNDKLKWRTQFTQEQHNNESRNYNPQYQSGADWARLESTLNKRMSESNNIQIDNTLTFQDNFGNHGVSLMAGFSTRKVDSKFLSGKATGVDWGDDGREEFLYFFNGDSDSQIATDGGNSSRGVSYMSRLMYNYSHKYLLNATFRADGTDKYSETWGYFPSVGIGWVLSEEQIFKDQNFVDYAKIRASWGQLGNNNVPRESGSQSIEFTSGNSARPYDHSYLFDGVLIQGYEASIDFNTLKWEITTEINAGLDLAFLNDRLSIETDWYRKVTSDAAIMTNGIMGAGVTPSLTRNVGEILNTGFEFIVDWHDKIGDFGYSFSANLTTLHNEVLKINDHYIQAGSFERRQRTTVGQPLYSFYGKEVIGVYQNQQEIDEHLNNTVDNAKPKPGYFKYKDLDQSGTIDADDYQYLGANIPKFTYGGNIALDYKGLDFGVKFYGIAGNKIQNGKFNLRSVRSHHTDQNFDRALYENRWTGEGTSNFYPSAEALTVGNSWNFGTLNSFLVESGSFFKINNITLGYTFKNAIPGSKNGSKIRIKLSADNPYTFFKYNGFDPNVGGSGADDNTYPLSSNYILGVNITY